ncbi:MAG: SAM-dependent methyltransferase [Acidobacteria bacterium]|nr:SAM-dependent methyltransferase [Acidobacteriota bacterium]
MRQSYSLTAEGMALLRAIEQARPPAQRIISDPYAAAFLRFPGFRFITRSQSLSRLMLRLFDWRAPGAVEFLTIRPRLVDELATELAAQGLEQIVILGAGFDTMALRIRDKLQGVTIYEVDHPATQAAKRETLTKIGTPTNVRFVAVDFEQDDFVEKLREAGFDLKRKTLISWLGVTYYLTPAAMARTLTQIATLGGIGTKFVFDYMLAEVIDGTSTSHEALNKARFVARLGEPWLFGLQPEKVGAYLAPFGFRVRQNFTPQELQAKYCPTRKEPMVYVRMAVCERM